MINRRRTFALAAALLATTALPAVASAAPNKRMPRQKIYRNMKTSEYKSWSESRMKRSHWRMSYRGRKYLSAERYRHLGYDLNAAIATMRGRIDSLGRDGMISGADQRHLDILNNAIRGELSRYGNFDSWNLL